MTRSWTAAEEEWLRGMFPTEHVPYIVGKFEEEFGRKVTCHAVEQKAHAMGLRHERRELPERAVRRVRWASEPEMQAWMGANDDGRSIRRLSEAFAEEFGFPLARTQISRWRASNGRSDKSHSRRGGGSPLRPIGAERESKGYVLVKVAERPTVPMSKDNWKLKQVAVYERERGPVPKDACVVFADHDNRNFDPANLVAVPRRHMARLNRPDCPEYHDAESLRAAVAWLELGSAIKGADWARPRPCGVCGRVFTPERTPKSYTTGQKPPQTCPACLAAGRKSQGKKTVKFEAVCPVCGSAFGATRKDQRRCPACIAEKPKHWYRNQIKRGGGGAA